VKVLIPIPGEAAPGLSGGVVVYGRGLVKALAASSVPELEVHCLRDWRVMDPRNGDCEEGEQRQGYGAIGAVAKRASKAVNMTATYARLWALRPFDIMHFPATYIPRRMHTLPGRKVITFFDMQHEYFPEYFSAEEMARRHGLYRPSVERARLIIAASRFTAETLREKYGLTEEKLRVVPPGADDIFYRPVSAQRIADIRYKYRLIEPYVIYPANTWPHKNHDTLLQAMSLLKVRGNSSCTLVLTGAPREAHGDLLQSLAHLDLSDRVLILGYVPREDLPGLYAGAAMLAFPSLFEGFGMPLVEAMACGCPVVCSDRTSVPEVVGEAALQFEPTDPESIAGRMLEVLEDGELAEELRIKGKRRAEQFSWPAVVPQIANAYRIAMV
jgi:glycosyltransferase involved in cell wall biosynthesis